MLPILVHEAAHAHGPGFLASFLMDKDWKHCLSKASSTTSKALDGMVKAPNRSNSKLKFEKSDAGKALVNCRYAAFMSNEDQNLNHDHPAAISMGLRALSPMEMAAGSSWSRFWPSFDLKAAYRQ